MSPRKIAEFPKPHKDKSGRRYYVEYDLIYEGGSSEWTGHYRTLWGAFIALYWNRSWRSWGGTATLYENDSWHNGQRNRKV